MLIYRICRSDFASTMNASGFAGRWNHEGQWVLYASASRSLAALEQLANRSGLSMSSPYSVMTIEIPDDAAAVHTVLPASLPDSWRSMASYGRLQEIGADWYRRSDTLLLRVPSVLVPQEFNYLIHTRHPDFASRVRLVEAEGFNWDGRLV